MKADFDAQDLAKKLTVTVEIKRYRQWLVRLWIAKQLIKLAGFIAWVDIEFSECDNADKLLVEILKSYNLWHNGKPEIAEEISATMDVSLVTAYKIVKYFDDNEHGNSDDGGKFDWLIERNQYRLMILKLLDGAPDTNIPQETRTKAYDLLDEYFVE